MFNERAFHALNKTRARDVNVTLSGEATVSGTVNATMTGIMYGNSEQVQTVQGKNLLDPEKYTAGYLKEDGTTGLSGTWVTFHHVKISPNTTYALSRCATSAVVYALLYDANKQITAVSQQTSATKIITTGSGDAYIRISSKTDVKWPPQIELGSTSTAYEPFVPNSPSPDYPSPVLNAGGGDLVVSGNDTSISFPVPVLRGIGDVKDTLEYVGGNDWELTRRIAVLELDGTESWTKYSPNTLDNVYYAEVFAGSVASYQSSICSHFKNVNSSWGIAGNYGEYSDHTSIGNRKYFNLGNLYPTADDFKTWLAAQHTAGTPVTVAYILETPVVSTVTVGALSTSYPETNYFDENTDVPIVFEATVKKM